MASRVAQTTATMASKFSGALADLALMSKPAVQTYGGLLAKELAPPSPGQWPQIKEGLSGLIRSTQQMKFLDITVKEALQGALVGTEVFCWFYVGKFAPKFFFVFIINTVILTI
eukprot:gene6542-9385_t